MSLKNHAKMRYPENHTWNMFFFFPHFFGFTSVLVGTCPTIYIMFQTVNNFSIQNDMRILAEEIL